VSKLGETTAGAAISAFIRTARPSDPKTLRRALTTAVFELGLCHLLKYLKQMLPAAGVRHRAAPVDVRDLRQIDFFGDEARTE